MRKQIAITELCLIFEINTWKYDQALVSLRDDLKESDILYYYLRPTENLIERLEQAKPEVIICGFLLGKYGTALELLLQLESSLKANHCSVIVWTDEPSVGSAVEAMKLGARDYIENTSKGAAQKVISQINLKNKSLELESTRKEPELVFSSLCAKLVLRELESAIAKRSRVVVLFALSGAGRSRFGALAHELRNVLAPFSEVELDKFQDSATSLLKPAYNSKSYLANGGYFSS